MTSAREGLRRGFYLLEESWPINGYHGDFSPYATADELHAQLEPKTTTNDVLLGESVNIWTVQQGRLTAGLDITKFFTAHLKNGDTAVVFDLIRHQVDYSGRARTGRTDPPPSDEGARLSLDWDGVLAALPPLEAPFAAPGDKDLTLRFDGPRPIPDTWSYVEDLIEIMADENRWEWQSLDYGEPTRV